MEGTEAERFTSFSKNNHIPKIKVVYDTSIENQRVVDHMTIDECNIRDLRSRILKAVRKELKKKTRQQQGQADDGGDMDRRWNSIKVRTCSGRLDHLIKEILASNVENLTIDTETTNPPDGFFDVGAIALQDLDEKIWPGLCEGLPPNTTLRSLDLRNLCFCRRRLTDLGTAFENYLRRCAVAGITPTRTQIRHVTLIQPNFWQNDHIDTTNFFRRYLFPSLKSLEISYCGNLSDDQFADFLSPLLLTGLQTSQQTSVQRNDSGANIECALEEFALEELRLDQNSNCSSQTMSVLAQWLSSSAQVLNICQNEDEENFVLGDEFLDALSKSNLRHFGLAVYDISSEEFNKLASALSKLIICQYMELEGPKERKKRSKILHFTDSDLSDHSCAVVSFFGSIGESITSSSLGERQYCALSDLNLYNCQLTDECLRALASQISQNYMINLTTLDLGGNQKFSQHCVVNDFIPEFKKNRIIFSLRIRADSYSSRRQLRLRCDVNRSMGPRLDELFGAESLPNLIAEKGKEKYSEKYQDIKMLLWPIIFGRVCNSMPLLETIPGYYNFYYGEDSGDNSTGNNNDNEENDNTKIIESDSMRRASVLYHLLLVQGAIVECCGNNNSVSRTGSDVNSTSASTKMKGERRRATDSVAHEPGNGSHNSKRRRHECSRTFFVTTSNKKNIEE